MIPCTPFNENNTLEILGKEYSIDEVIKLRNWFKEMLIGVDEFEVIGNICRINNFLTDEINRIQQPVYDKLHRTPNHSGINT